MQVSLPEMAALALLARDKRASEMEAQLSGKARLLPEIWEIPIDYARV